jgi:hypothetical protein
MIAPRVVLSAPAYLLLVCGGFALGVFATCLTLGGPWHPSAVVLVGIGWAVLVAAVGFASERAK